MTRQRRRITCVFCRERRPQAQEHVWSNWLGKELQRRTGQRGWATVYREDGGLKAQRQIAYTSKVSDVCRICNEGWMHDIEEAARTLLIPMIFDAKPLLLGHDEQDHLACWVYLRTLVLQAAADTPINFPQHWYWQLAETHRPPATAHIFLGCLIGARPSASVFYAKTLDAAGTVVFGGSQPEAYYATVSVGQLVARVFLHSPLAERGGQFANVETPGFRLSLVPIWPHSFGESWPPVEGLALRPFMRLVMTIPTATHLRSF